MHTIWNCSRSRADNLQWK